jgi:hypothetical protein
MSQVTYEVTATVDTDVCLDYERFMIDTHIPEMMATGNFASASLGRSEPGRYRVRYEAKDRAALERYLAHDAPAVRKHFVERFPTGVELSREEWETVAEFSGGDQLAGR